MCSSVGRYWTENDLSPREDAIENTKHATTLTLAHGSVKVEDRMDIERGNRSDAQTARVQRRGCQLNLAKEARHGSPLPGGGKRDVLPESASLSPHPRAGRTSEGDYVHDNTNG